MCEVAPSLADTYARGIKALARDFVTRAVNGAQTYCTQYTPHRKTAAYAGFVQGARWAAAQLANTPELSLAMQRDFEKYLLNGEFGD